MSEEDAIAAIKRDCRTWDLEHNGCAVDEIVDKFLRANGYEKLADEIQKVECWRA